MAYTREEFTDLVRQHQTTPLPRRLSDLESRIRRLPRGERRDLTLALFLSIRHDVEGDVMAEKEERDD